MITARFIEDTDPISEEKLPIEIGKDYKVEDIDMGQSFTFVALDGISEAINSVLLEFYEDGEPLDIYSDHRFNPYL